MPYTGSPIRPWVSRLGLLLFLGGIGFLLLLRYFHPRVSLMPATTPVKADLGFEHAKRPEPTPTPGWHPIQRMQQIIVHPVQAAATPHAQPTPCQPCIEVIQRYLHDIHASFPTTNERQKVTNVQQVAPVSRPNTLPVYTLVSDPHSAELVGK